MIIEAIFDHTFYLHKCVFWCGGHKIQLAWRPFQMLFHKVSWASYQIRKIAVCACSGNAGNDFPHRRFRRKPLVSDPGMHHGTCVTHVPWCMSGSLTCGGGKNVPGIPGACAPAILRIWQEAHGNMHYGEYVFSIHRICKSVTLQKSSSLHCRIPGWFYFIFV